MEKNNENSKKSLEIVIIAIIVAFLAISLISVIAVKVNNGLKAKELSGKWSDSVTAEFTFDGKVYGSKTVDGYTYDFTYKSNGKTVSIDYTDKTIVDEEYNYSLKNNLLIMISANDDSTRYMLSKITE